ncbi:MAG: lactonase family protein [Lachnospiraceae bacterium]|uniref:Lactonase family protein n=1 Tax=Candidatus Enterocloster excrementigallinarum TaxID=2838558 RepID=A0A9D2TES0_9FIRM|nr:lactonase family protein [Lachnospiraceae bacterium]HJC67239.1 lactonase family protein [Candidatus Enterocloster excrementigallinarum]
MKGKYMAYVGSYSYTGKAKGITVFDVDVEKGQFQYRCEMEVDNSSYVIASSDGKTLYSIADEGVVAFRILENGSLARLNSASIRGMRGCHLCTDAEDKYVFVSGYHDGKATVLSLNPDGSVGSIVDGVFDKGYGSVAERNFRPHVTCTRRTPDGKYVMSVDNGIDQVRIYRFTEKEQKLKQVDAIRCDLESAPRHFRFSADGRFIYLIYELKTKIDVFSYKTGERAPIIEKIQTVSTTSTENPGVMTAACAMRLSWDQKYLYCSNAGENTVSVFSRDEETGLLTRLCCLPVSGEYPKDIAVFPDSRHIVSVNHESGSLSFFTVDYEKGLMVMSGRSIPVNEPNCCAIVKIR